MALRGLSSQLRLGKEAPGAPDHVHHPVRHKVLPFGGIVEKSGAPEHDAALDGRPDLGDGRHLPVLAGLGRSDQVLVVVVRAEVQVDESTRPVASTAVATSFMSGVVSPPGSRSSQMSRTPTARRPSAPVRMAPRH